MKVATWNVNGIRARRDEFTAWAATEAPDIICLQEIKASPVQVAESIAELTDLPAYASYWHGSEKGYSGVSIHVRRGSFPGHSPVFSHPAFDHETRIVEMRLGALRIASVYVPNGGKDYSAKLAFLRELGSHVIETAGEGAPHIVCGDMNVTRSDLDLHVSERKRGAVGQRSDERALFEALLTGGRLVDVCRAMNPDDDQMFTWWPYWREARARNVGWRIDYVLASSSLRCTGVRVASDVGTSDHAPVVAILDL